MNRRYILLLIVSMLVIGLFAKLFVVIENARDVARESSCGGKIKHLGQALLNYESAHKRFPLAVETKDEALWRSWRTHVNPAYMEQMQTIYDPQYSWESEVNMRLLNGTPVSVLTDKFGEKPRRLESLSRVPECFSCPKCSSGKGHGVNYVVVRGEQTAFPKLSSIGLQDMMDGPENTILLVESITCTPDWTEPRDLEFDTMKFTVNAPDGPSISSNHPSGALVCFADCGVFIVTPEVTEGELRAMLTIAGNENTTRSQLIERGVLKDPRTQKR
jgi:hypothetical protein